MRGRKPKPTALKLIQGNPGNYPLPKHEPKVDPALPDPPSFLSFEAREEWTRVARELYLIGVLSAFDRAALAAYCQAYGRWEIAERKLNESRERDRNFDGLIVSTTQGNAIQNPLIGIANTAMREMLKAAAEFGMTPASRARVSVPESQSASKWAGLIGS